MKKISITPNKIIQIINEEFASVAKEYKSKRKTALNEEAITTFSSGVVLLFYTVKGGLPKGYYYSDYLETFEGKIVAIAKQFNGNVYGFRQNDPQESLGGMAKIKFKTATDKMKFKSTIGEKLGKSLAIKIS
jgi:hypothetical protein